ncbi:PfkB family carbohydrate kinase [Actinophytocola sp.]|uniref:PfkB family carbohydrate kinase n=1 Tax=Actinophytocola sp. TaxID=1872138 RepID=UPI0038998911
MVAAVGLCTVDVVQRVETLPAPGEKVQSLSVEVAAGGPATNAAVAVAALGGRVRLSTVLGAHPLARLAAADLSACGVELTDALPTRTDPPPISAVSVRTVDGERTVVAHNAKGVQTPAVIDLTDATALLVDGHHPTLAMHAAREAKNRGIPVVLDAGSWKPVLTDLLPFVDIAACSAAFTSPEPLTTPIVIRTNGANPVTWSTAETTGEVPAKRVTAKDTSGAGDVWHGALTLAVANLARVPTASDLPRLIEYANEAAAIRIQHEGARAWVKPMLDLMP